ncbi:MAG: 1-deoxy-D-xylulose-5-phosphate reductoisomerase [Proteobacteria bacterium]|nr:1-deoxy-D-xylulose-5-phosphate reductoisomerase [Pseudomonadota bacterium]
MKNLLVLGATGSIGDSTFDVVRLHPDKFRVFALSGHTNVKKMLLLAKEFEPEYLVISDDSRYLDLKAQIDTEKTEVLSGHQALVDLVKKSEIDLVVAGIVGSAGMASVLAAVEAGKTLLLANKESIVVAGSLMMQKAKETNACIIPLDSEHNALYQCLYDDYQTGEIPKAVEKIILTASGGPFWNYPEDQFYKITPKQAVAHPKWDMGAKISVDSASLMNKGLEVIEAHYLFNMPEKNIEVVIHPQSIIHSMVCYHDGSVLAQMGNPDMRIPISYGLGMRNRINSGANSLDFSSINKLEFFQPDTKKFPCLNLAREAIKLAGTAPAILNAANEVSVAMFLADRIKFPHIAQINDRMLDTTTIDSVESLDQLIEIDQHIRNKTMAYIKTI